MDISVSGWMKIIASAMIAIPTIVLYNMVENPIYASGLRSPLLVICLLLIQWGQAVFTSLRYKKVKNG